MKIWSRRIAQNMNEKFEKFCPKSLEHNFSKFFVHILGNAMTSHFHSEISWALVLATLQYSFRMSETDFLCEQCSFKKIFDPIVCNQRICERDNIHDTRRKVSDKNLEHHLLDPHTQCLVWKFWKYSEP